MHDDLSRQVAGVEVYTSWLLAGQRSRHDVGVLSARFDPTRKTGELVQHPHAVEGVQHFEAIQNRDWWRFEQTWRDPRMKPAYDAALDRFDPDLLHVQHLMNLTLSLVEVAVDRGIPIVMTLHDHFMACANGGQRFHPDRTRCEELDAGVCGRCTWTQVGPLLAIKGRRAAARGLIELDPGRAAGREVPPDRLRRLRGRMSRIIPAPFGVDRIEKRWEAMRLLGDRLDLLIAPSRDLARAMIEFGLPESKIQILPHGLPDPSAVEPALLGDHAEHFGYLGSLVPHKGVHHLVTAFNGMPEDAVLSIYGSLTDDPGYVAELRGLAMHPGIRFVGEVPPTEVPTRLATLDCLVAPSIWRENAPLGVQQALAARVAVVATDLGGHRELLEQGGGLLVPPGDDVALRTALQRLHSEQGLARRLAEAAPPPRGIETHLAELDRLYDAVPGLRKEP